MTSPLAGLLSPPVLECAQHHASLFALAARKPRANSHLKVLYHHLWTDPLPLPLLSDFQLSSYKDLSG